MKTLHVICAVICVTVIHISFVSGSNKDWKCIEDNMNAIGDKNPSLKPWLNDNRSRLLDLFSDYNDCIDSIILYKPICMGKVTISGIIFRNHLKSTVTNEHIDKLPEIIHVIETCLDISLQ